MSRISLQILGVAAALVAGSAGALAQQSRAIQVVGPADEQKAEVETLVPVDGTQAPVTTVAQPETAGQPELAEAPVAAPTPVVREGRYVKDAYGRVFFVRDMAHGRYVALISDPTQDSGASYGHRVSTGYAYGGRAYAGRGPTCHR